MLLYCDVRKVFVVKFSFISTLLVLYGNVDNYPKNYEELEETDFGIENFKC